MKRHRPQSARAGRNESLRDKTAVLPIQLVTIEKPIYGGAFLTRAEGKAIFVPLTLPGEQARVRIAEAKRGYATAEIEEIVAASPTRIVPACQHFGACGGCSYQHTGYGTQLAFKQSILRETLARGGVRATDEIKVLAAATEAQSWGYRNRIRLAMDAAGNPGYRGRRSHAVIPIAECPIASPLLVTASAKFAEAARPLRQEFHPTEMSFYCDCEEGSLLASVSCATVSSRGAKIFEGFCVQLAAQIPELKGVELVVEPRAAEREKFQQPRTVAKWGKSSLTYWAAGFDYRVDNGAFFQVNRWMVDSLVDEVTAGQKGNLAWDLFAGVGLFSRKLTDSFARVLAVESAPQATAALEENLRGTSGVALKSTTLDFLKRKSKGERPDLIVVDPPRTGLGAEVTALLSAAGASNLVYVSCDPATLARDLRMLVESGYSIDSVTLADLFPHTFHLETVVHLRRS